MGTILQRIKEISLKENESITAIESRIGASKGVLSRALNKDTDIQSKWITKIVENYPHYSAGWLLTGKGAMLKSSVETLPVAVPATSGIPFVLPTAIGGMGNDSFTLSERDVKDYYVIPKFKHKQVDFMIEVEGSSMYPKYNSGDVVACRIVAKESFIQWNKTHVIATRGQGIIIKRLKRGSTPESLCMISDNENYDPFEVPMDEITGMALVVGVIRIE